MNKLIIFILTATMLGIWGVVFTGKNVFALDPCQVQCTAWNSVSDTCGTYSGTTSCGTSCAGNCTAGDRCSECPAGYPTSSPQVIGKYEMYARIFYMPNGVKTTDFPIQALNKPCGNGYMADDYGISWMTPRDLCNPAPYIYVYTESGEQTTLALTRDSGKPVGSPIYWDCQSVPAGKCPDTRGLTVTYRPERGVQYHFQVYVGPDIQLPKCTVGGPTTVCSKANLAISPSYTYTAAANLGGVNKIELYNSSTSMQNWILMSSTLGSATTANGIQFASAGSYYAVCNASNTTSGTAATGNPWCLGPPWSCAGWTDAGANSRMTVTTQSALAGPTTVIVQQNPQYPTSGGPIQVKWTKVTGATGYNVYLNCGLNCWAKKAGLLLSDLADVNNPYWNNPDTTLSCGTNYTYKITPILSSNLPECQEAIGQTGLGMCTVNTAWFSANGGDVVAAGGSINVTMPYGTDKFIDAGLSGKAGMAIGNPVAGLLPTRVSVDNWLVSLTNPMAALLQKQESGFSYIKEKIVAQKLPQTYNISQSLLANITNAKAAGKTINGISIMENNGPMNLSAVDIGNEKGVLIVDGDANIVGNINLANGFLLVLASGNINVSPSVGEAAPQDIRLPAYIPQVEGIYYAQGRFNTGVSSKQLRVDGTVVGLGGVSLQRTYVGMSPAEYFYFRPDLVSQLVNLGIRKKIVQELDTP